MKKKSSVICIVSLLTILLAIGIILFPKENDKPNQNAISSNMETAIKEGTLAQIKSVFLSDIQRLKDGTYTNLIATDFTTSIDAVEEIHRIEVLTNYDYKEKSFLENLADMNVAIDKFFQQEVDKSFIEATIYLNNDECIAVAYNDIEKVCEEQGDNLSETGYLFGSSEFMVQIFTGFYHTWFSREELGGILPSSADEYREVFPYISCIRQTEDAVIQLKDGQATLSDMENEILTYLNSDDFPLPKNENIDFGIGEARVLDCGDYEGLCFKLRRIYKGIPFEYGSASASGEYIDTVNNDGAELSYAVSTFPDTMLLFGNVNGAIVETSEITELLSAGEALAILSESIGENSTYQVHGVELVYRACEIPKEREQEVSDILTPRWKVITTNQNDNKYTLFYIDVVTGEITERFEYYYE